MRRYLFKMAIPYDRPRRKRGPWRSYFRALKMPLLVWTACRPSSQVLHIKFLVQNSIAPLGIFSDQLSFSPPKTIRACLHKVPLKKLVDEPVDAKLFCQNLSGSSRSQIYYFTDYVCGTQTQLSEWILSCVVLKIDFSQFSTFARENMLLEKVVVDRN